MVYHELVSEAVAGGVIAGLIALGVIFAILIFAGIYVYYALAWYTIAKKMGYRKAWLAWIPIAQWAMMLQLGGFSWIWILLVLIPIVGWLALVVLLIIANWRIFEARGHPGWFSLSMIIPQVGFILYLVAIGIVAWSDKKGSKVIVKTKSRKKRRR